MAWTIWGGLGGAIAGSFLATLILRWERGERVTAGRSRCDGCGRALRVWELVPLLSAALGGGRCARCGTAIEPLHGRVEATAAGLCATAFALLPPPQAAAWCVLAVLLLPLAVLDLRALWLPDALTLPLATAGLLIGGVATGVPTVDRLIGGAVGFATLWALARAFERLRGVRALGGGDPKLAGAIGCWIGWTALPALCALAGVAGVVLLLLDRPARGAAQHHPIPFGTALAIAAWPAWWTASHTLG